MNYCSRLGGAPWDGVVVRADGGSIHSGIPLPVLERRPGFTMATLEHNVQCTRWQISLRITQATTEMGGRGFGWKSEGGRDHAAKKSPPEGFTRQWSWAREGFTRQGRGAARKNVEITRDPAKKSTRGRRWQARPLAKDAEREKQIS
jgi:hypothetical protein